MPQRVTSYPSYTEFICIYCVSLIGNLMRFESFNKVLMFRYVRSRRWTVISYRIVSQIAEVGSESADGGRCSEESLVSHDVVDLNERRRRWQNSYHHHDDTQFGVSSFTRAAARSLHSHSVRRPRHRNAEDRRWGLSPSPRSTQPSIPLGKVNRLPALPAGVKAGCARLCRSASTIVWHLIWWHPRSPRWL